MTSLVPTPTSTAAADLLDDLRALRQGVAALPGLEPDSYARDHAAFTAKGVRFTEAPRREAYGTVAVFADLGWFGLRAARRAHA